MPLKAIRRRTKAIIRIQFLRFKFAKLFAMVWVVKLNFPLFQTDTIRRRSHLKRSLSAIHTQVVGIAPSYPQHIGLFVLILPSCAK